MRQRLSGGPSRRFFRLGRRLGTGRRGRLEARCERFDQQIDDLLGAIAVGILVRIELRDVQSNQVLVAHDFLQGRAHVFEAQAAASGHDHRGKILLRDNIQVKMQDKLARISMQVSQRVERRRSRALCLYVRGMHVAQRRAGKEILFGGIEPCQTEERDVGLAPREV